MNKILIVEDDRFLSKLLSRKLHDTGYAPVSAYDGDEALAKAQSEKPDLVLLDLIIPGKDGFEVLARLKADPATSAIPVIVASNLGQPEDIVRVMSQGAIDFISKVNSTPDDIVSKVGAFFGTRPTELPPSATMRT
jgi:CheY-like chemotaxis protein